MQHRLFWLTIICKDVSLSILDRFSIITAGFLVASSDFASGWWWLTSSQPRYSNLQRSSRPRRRGQFGRFRYSRWAKWVMRWLILPTGFRPNNHFIINTIKKSHFKIHIVDAILIVPTEGVDCIRRSTLAVCYNTVLCIMYLLIVNTTIIELLFNPIHNTLLLHRK